LNAKIDTFITVKNISKSYGGIIALKNIDLDIVKGEFVVVLGPNGAGKSTLLKVISTILRPSSGKILIDNKDNSEELRKLIGFLSHESYLYENLSALENLKFYAELYDISNPSEKARDLINKVELDSRADDLISNYSKGMKQRISLCRALLHDPEILLLDEPYSGLDLLAVSIIDELLNDLHSSGKTILMSTHSHEESINLGQRTLVLANGELKLDTSDKIDKSDLMQIYTDSIK